MMIFCFGCVIWQASICYEKYASNPTGAQVVLTNTQQVGLSFTFCKIIYRLQENHNGRLFSENIEHLKELSIVTNNGSYDLLKDIQSPLTYEFVSSVPENYLCKEFPFPRENINRVKIVHESWWRDKKSKNFHIFIHPTGMFLQTEMVVKYSNKIFHKDFDGKVEIKMESYDLANSPEIVCGGENYHQCIIENIIKEYNKTMRCTYPIQR